ncbi:mitochondrion organization and biogenesis protein [Penicillium malachiteum]|uniref:mitochondrion organization and biogenesis protein n=1 Tax=Penicillium malachiteum TaxID=1324776 RepID=UPI0025498CF3|nr:mitochondrion organization and biogenesis protein [Penicillium malachiteum]KAJ5729448.1 mitochondrion organization and biogenesis protein [Penicillium malachiteum]
MASKCAAPASLALPTVLRGILRSNFTQIQRPSPLIACHRRPYQPRSFSSTTAFYHDPKQHVAPEQKGSSATKSSNDIIETLVDSSSHSSDSPKRPSNKPKKFDGATKKTYDRKYSKSSDKKNQFHPKTKKFEHWQIQKDALDKKFPDGWNPQKKLSPDAMDGIRQLHASAPEKFTTAVLSKEFKVSPESIRRILKSKWKPSGDEMESRRKRWEKRHERIWSHMAELGLRPMTKSSQSLSDSRKLYQEDKKKDQEGSDAKEEQGDKPEEGKEDKQ